jgi:tungstate transport system substrate-binding protein
MSADTAAARRALPRRRARVDREKQEVVVIRIWASQVAAAALFLGVAGTAVAEQQPRRLSGVGAAEQDATLIGDQNSRRTVRLLTVGAANTAGFLANLVAGFEEATGHRVEIIVGAMDIFDQARAGEADIVLAHFGFTELQDFVAERRGLWPELILSNTVVFLVPPGDPAGILGVDDPVEAFQRIADLRTPFVVNDLGETRFITDTLWNATGRPDKGEWFLDLGLVGRQAVQEAARRGAYTLWGLHPFLMLQQQNPVGLEPLVINDSLMQRIIASVVVLRASGRLNIPGALALQRYLVDPSTQALIRAFRLPNIDRPIFWPAANNNDN